MISSAATLTAKKRAAWKPAWPSPAAKVQWRFQKKLLLTATQKAPIAAIMWWTPRLPLSKAKTREVDQVAGAADQAELDQLPPARRAAGGGADPVGEFGRRSRQPPRLAVDDHGVEAETGVDALQLVEGDVVGAVCHVAGQGEALEPYPRYWVEKRGTPVRRDLRATC